MVSTPAITTISPAKGVRLRIHRPVPPRPGPSVLGLTLMPSTISLPVRVSFDPARPTCMMYRAVGKQIGGKCKPLHRIAAMYVVK